MVAMRLAANQRGKVRLGCLLWALVGLAGGYIGIEYARVYWDWFEAKQEIEELAGFAGQLEDSAIQRRIVERVTALDLPPQARQVRLWRVSQPRGIRIALSYADSVDLLFTKREVQLAIEVGRTF